jgi:chromate transport protein ChrA
MRSRRWRPAPTLCTSPSSAGRWRGGRGQPRLRSPGSWPAGTLTLLVGHLHSRYPQAALGRAIRRGLTPISLGLMLASGWILMRAVNHDWRGYLLTLLTVGLVLRTPWNPLWLLAAGALVGMAGLV